MPPELELALVKLEMQVNMLLVALLQGLVVLDLLVNSLVLGLTPTYPLELMQVDLHLQMLLTKPKNMPQLELAELMHLDQAELPQD